MVYSTVKTYITHGSRER